MNTGTGEAADQVVRMILSGGEVAVQLGGSALKNSAAMIAALLRSHHKIYGRTSLARMLRETRDIRVFPMSREQYGQFRQAAKQMKVLYAGVQDRRHPDAPVDLMLPAADLERANRIFERMGYGLSLPKEEAGAPSKKGSRSRQGSGAIRRSSDTPSKDGSSREGQQRPSVLARLEGYRQQQTPQTPSVPTREKARPQIKSR